MRILGLTGSIGMGKSTAAAMLKRMGIPVHEADRAVHGLFQHGGAAVRPIADAFPGVVVDGAVDRQRLGARVFGDEGARRRLEAIVHPLVRAEARRFLRRHRLGRTPLVVLDIPLLFETGGDRLCDAVVVVTAPARLQAMRVLRRPGMTREKFEGIRAAQMPDAEKRRRADFVVYTSLGKHDTLRQLRRIVRMLRSGRVDRPGAPRGTMTGNRTGNSIGHA
jgi:dephospho-CoA kinase